MGRPGGGILALRGHASIQGSTDIPTLFDLLPGYLPMPMADRHPDLSTYERSVTAQKGFWSQGRAYFVSLLKAWWGDAARPENDFCFDYLPRLTGDHSAYLTALDMFEGTVSGYFLFGENPAVGSANSRTSGRWSRSRTAAPTWASATTLGGRSARSWPDPTTPRTGVSWT